MLSSIAAVFCLLVAVQCKPAYVFRTSVTEEEMSRCHMGFRDTGHRCREYVTKDMDKTKFPALPANCTTVEWQNANETNNWGNCFAMTTDEEFRYISSNNVPDYYVNPYCPLGIGFGYCVKQEIEGGTCMFPNMTCGADNGPGSAAFGDFWVPAEGHYKIPLIGNPTRSDRPGDMYDATTVGGEKNIGPSAGVAINGIGIQGPNDAGDVSIDEAGIQLTCGGHVTPPLGNQPGPGPDPGPGPHPGPKPGPGPHPGPGPDPGPPPPPGPAGPPMYHYHKSPECQKPFLNASIGADHGAKPYLHGKLIGWSMDGFKIFTYQDVGGAAPVVDECGGHFGPIDTGEIEYHYHSRTITPYHMACQGPSLGRCAETQKGTNFCHPGCGADICVQPGTDEAKLREYLAQWDPTWLDKYTVNDYQLKTEEPKESVIEKAIERLLDYFLE